MDKIMFEQCSKASFVLADCPCTQFIDELPAVFEAAALRLLTNAERSHNQSKLLVMLKT